MEKEEIELVEDNMEEILGKPPHWMIRYGSLLISIIVLIGFIFSYFIKYPDIVTASISLTTENLPVNLVAENSGSIETFFVTEKQRIDKGDLVALIQSTAIWRDVVYISEYLDSLYLKPLSHPKSDNIQLGEIQDHYLVFLDKLYKYENYLKNDFDKKEEKGLLNEINSLKNMRTFYSRQIDIHRLKCKSSYNIYAIDSILFQQKQISIIEMENSKSTYLSDLQNYESQKNALENLNLSIIQKRNELTEIERNEIENKTYYKTAFYNSVTDLKNAIENWKKKYLFISPVDGIISLPKYKQSFQYVKSGEVIANIVPIENIKIIGKIHLNLQDAGKVKKGQKAWIKLSQFPHMEFGMIQISMQDYSIVPTSDKNGKYFIMEINLSQPLVTNYGKTIPFIQEMEGSVEIITEDHRLIEKLFNPVRYLLHRNFK